MIHLTLTGYLAGTPICLTESNVDDTYVHAIYYERIQDKENVCPECVKVLNEVDNETS